jgi:outer membrane receptor protein involved in Fe transport
VGLGLKFLLLMSGTALFVPATAWAQASGTNPPSDVGLDEIIVTANKRQQSASTVGMSINAVSGDQLKALNVNNVQDLVKIEPSFVVGQSLLGTPVYTIRGVGFNSSTTASPDAVSVYVDETPLAFNTMSKGATLDLERVEILKGPQGTLFGQNSTAGAINYIAAKPTDRLSYGAEGTYGRFGAADFNGFVSGPLSDTLGARLSATTSQGGTWQRSTTRDDSLGDKDFFAARLLLDWAPSENLKVSLNLNGFWDNSENQEPAFYALAPAVPPFLPLVPGLLSEPPSSHDPRDANWRAGTHPSSNQDFYQAALRADYTISDFATITYLGTYQHFTQDDVHDQTGADVGYNARYNSRIRASFQELRATGKLLDNKLNWLIGGTYSTVKGREDQFEDLTDLTNSYVLTAFVPQPLKFINQHMTQDITTKAMFGNLEYHLLSNLSVHAGIRQTRVENDHTGCTRALDDPSAQAFTALQSALKGGVGVVPINPGDCLTFDNTLTPTLVRDSLNESSTSWRIGIDFMPVDRTLLYLTVSKGYKAGSFPNIGASTVAVLAPAVQESVLAYEAGIKTRFLDNRVDIEGSVFLYDYKNKQQQLRAPDPLGVFGFINAVLNVPEARITGAELSVKVRPVSALTLNGAVTYLDSKVSNTFFNVNQFVNTLIDFKGEPLPNTPKWSLSVGARYDWNLSDRWKAFVGADGRYQSRTQSYFGTANAISLGFPSQYNYSYALLNLRAGVETEDGHWRIQAFGDNVTNTYYTTQAVRTDTVARFTGMPATWGVTVGYRY